MWEKLSAEFPKMFSGAFLFFLGLAVKAVSDKWRKWRENPLLKVTFDERADCQSFDDERETHTLELNTKYKFMYVRIAVTNINPEIAKDVMAYLVDVENVLDPTAAKPSHFVKTEYHDSLPLIWSNEPSTPAVVLPKGVTRHFDLVALSEGEKHYEVQFRGSNGKRMEVGGYESLFKKSSGLRFTVLVAGDNCEPQLLSLTIVWNGSWPPKIVLG